MKKYDEVSVVRQLNNVDAVIGINPASKVIKVAKNSSIGNGTSGKIDFLSHYCGYHVEIVDVIQQQKERDSLMILNFNKGLPLMVISPLAFFPTFLTTIFLFLNLPPRTVSPENIVTGKQIGRAHV